jgi:hypothetical protein
MRWAKQIEHGLDRVEAFQWYFQEDRVPAGHRAVPKTRPLQCAQRFPRGALLADDSGVWISELIEPIRYAVAITE